MSDTLVTDQLPDIIRTQHDGVRFCFWLEGHPEVTGVQGWTIRRDISDSNMPTHFGDHYADAEWLWSERKALNDWIRTYRKRHPEMTKGK